MKIKITPEKDIQVLSASETITLKDMMVLKAGIAQLFKNGKNKIVLEVLHPQGILPEVLRELAALDVLARELSGRVVLLSSDPETRKKIEQFASPPVIPCFESRASALQSFAPPPSAPVPVATASAAAPGPGPGPGKDAGKEAGLYKEEILAREKGDVGALRKQISELERENKTLVEQLLTAVIARRTPPSVEAYEEKIKTLEAELETRLEKG